MLIFSLVETETTERLGNSSKATENILTSIMLCYNQCFEKIKFGYIRCFLYQSLCQSTIKFQIRLVHTWKCTNIGKTKLLAGATMSSLKINYDKAIFYGKWNWHILERGSIEKVYLNFTHTHGERICWKSISKSQGTDTLLYIYEDIWKKWNRLEYIYLYFELAKSYPKIPFISVKYLCSLWWLKQDFILK